MINYQKKRKKKIESLQEDSWTYWQDKIFSGERLCEVCGTNIDIPYYDILFNLHGICWQEFRKKGKKYLMPAYTGNWI